ncbi:MAG: NYN domain-containing protein [Cyanobacteria bacterium]|nr:NYN domain-containing protein [Cyanobacteriota bacterium]MDA0867592.1 NYN domain-containing protein [Cyanobacteriota bacterium]
MANSPYLATLYVDGYNMVGSWPELTQLRDQGGLAAARDQLMELMVNYSAYQQFHTHLVFDAYTQATPAAVEPVTEHLSLHYTDFGQTADSYIERYCARWRANPGRLIVATSDRAQQLTVMGYGAEWMSALQLSADVLATARRHRDQHHRQAQLKRNQRFLAHSLSPEAQLRLQKMRFGQR